MTTTAHEREHTGIEVTPRDVLHRAADLLEEYGWCQLRPAVDAKGLVVAPSEPGAVKFCLGGAIERALADFGYDTATWRPEDFAAFAGIEVGYASWNDRPGRTKAEVVALLRDTAGRAHRT